MFNPVYSGHDRDTVFCLSSIVPPNIVEAKYLQRLYNHCTQEQKAKGSLCQVEYNRNTCTRMWLQPKSTLCLVSLVVNFYNTVVNGVEHNKKK